MNTGQRIRDVGSSVALATVVVIGVFAIGTAPVVATGDQANIAQDFGFDDDGDSGFDFGGNDNESDGDGPEFDFGDDDDGPGFDFGDDGDGPEFDFGDDDDGPEFDFGDDDGDDGDGNESDGGTEPAAPVDFQLSGVSDDGPVTAGDTLDLTATVENVGDQQGSQTVSLSVDGVERDSQSLTLAGGESQQVTLSWETAAGDAGNYTATVETANDSAGTSVSVTEQLNPANFAVSQVSNTGPVMAGDSVEVTATVTNTGDQQGTQTVSLGVGGSVDERVDSQSLTLAGGESQQVTLSWQTRAGQTGDFSLSVVSADDSTSTTATVEAQSDPANFRLSSTSSNSPVVAGNAVEVTTTLTNTGDLEGTQTVSLSVGGVERASQSVTLAGGASQQVTLSWGTAAGDVGEYTATVATANDTGTTGVTVEEQPDPATLQVSSIESNSPVTEGETLTVDATVENTGDLEGTQTVSLGVNGVAEDSQQVTLAGGASQTVTLSWQTTTGETGTFQTSVTSANDTVSTDVTVEAQPDPATFALSGVSNNSPVTAGDTVEVTATVENTGDLEGTQTIQLTDGSAALDSQDVTLAGGASQQVTLSWTTQSEDAGEYDLTLRSDDDTATATVSVTEQPNPANFAVSEVSEPGSVTAGGTVEVTATVTNTGDQQGTQTVYLTVGGDVDDRIDNRELTLAGGASQQVTLSWQTQAGQTGDYGLFLVSANDSAQTSVTVEAQPDLANLTVSGTSSNSPVTAGDTVEVTTTLTNTGDLEGTQTVSLSVGGTERASQSLTLAGGESQQVTLSWGTAAGDAGEYTATVATTNDTDSTGVTVEEQPDSANFTITGTSSDSPVTEAETLTVDATVRNDGDLQGSQTVDLTVANTVRDSRTVQLAGGASTTVSLSWTTASGDAGDYTATVETANDSETTPVTVESATIQPTSFDGVAEDGYVEINGSSGQRFDLQPCPDGQPLNNTYQCLSVDATVDGDSWSAAPSDVTFPNQTAEGPFGGQLTIVVTTPNGLSGTLDPETGRATVNGTLQIRVPGLGAGCGTSFVVNATTGTSGGLTGTPLSVNGTTARATIVDGSFSVPGASGCGTFLNDALNGQVGIPSPSGQNELSLDLYLDLQEAS